MNGGAAPVSTGDLPHGGEIPDLNHAGIDSHGDYGNFDDLGDFGDFDPEHMYEGMYL